MSFRSLWLCLVCFVKKVSSIKHQVLFLLWWLVMVIENWFGLLLVLKEEWKLKYVVLYFICTSVLSFSLFVCVFEIASLCSLGWLGICCVANLDTNSLTSFSCVLALNHARLMVVTLKEAGKLEKLTQLFENYCPKKGSHLTSWISFEFSL